MRPRDLPPVVRLLLAACLLTSLGACPEDSPTDPGGGGGGGSAITIAAVEPSTGGAVGGDEVLVRGDGFRDPARVLFDGRAAEVLAVTPTTIRVRTPASSEPVPAGLRRAVDVRVEVGSGADAASATLSNGFEYLPGGGGGGGGGSPITVSSVAPTEGSNAGGTRITIEGKGFQAPVEVRFGQGDDVATFQGNLATVESTTATRLVVVAPPALGFGIDNRNRTVDLLIRNSQTGDFLIVSDAFRYR